MTAADRDMKNKAKNWLLMGMTGKPKNPPGKTSGARSTVRRGEELLVNFWTDRPARKRKWSSIQCCSTSEKQEIELMVHLSM